MVRGHIFSLMGERTKAVSKMGKDMGKVLTLGQMGKNMLENGNMARAMDRVYSHGQMEKATQVIGKKVNMMVTGHTH